MNILFFVIYTSFINIIFAIKLTIRESDVNNRYSIERGSLLTLTCQSDSISQKESIQWFLPSSPTFPVTVTDSTQRVSYKLETIGNKQSVVLTIRDISNEYSGTFHCKSYQYEGNAQILLASAEVLISLFKPITPIICQNEQWIMISSKATLKCELDSEPRAIVTWEFKGVQLTQSSKYKISDWGLEIYDVQKSDEGQYVVKARTIDHSSSMVQDIIVKTYEMPKIISGPTIIGPVTNGVVEYWYSDIQCLATGNPMPTVHWFRKKSGLQELQLINPQKFFINTNPKVGTMRIFMPVYPDDNDEYTCQAMIVNEAIQNFEFPRSVVSRSINISVSVRPYFDQIEQLVTVQDPGKIAFIRCRVRTTDPVSLLWQKYIGPVYEMGTQKTDPRITVSLVKEQFNELYQVLRLEIANVRFEDSWNYTCIATSPGYNYSINGTILVRQKPVLSNYTPTIEYGWLFNATNLTCISHGLPHPTRWFWYRHDYSVLNDINSTFRIISYDFERSSQSWLQILPDISTQSWIFDIYKCQAMNEAGEDRKYVRFNRAQVPGVPQIISANATSSSLVFKIEPSVNDGGMKLLHFEMIYRAIQGPNIMYGPVIYRPDQTTIRMNGLVHNTDYQVSFYSCNAVGRSSDTTIFSRTFSATVPTTVQVVSKDISGYPYGYNLEWKVPLNGGYPLLGYRILLWPMAASLNYHGNTSRGYLVCHPEFLITYNMAKTYEPVLSNPYESVFRLDDLEAETIYKVTIEAKNMLGYSNRTAHYFYTPIRDSLGKPPRVRGFQDRLHPFMPLILGIIFLFIAHLFIEIF